MRELDTSAKRDAQGGRRGGNLHWICFQSHLAKHNKRKSPNEPMRTQRKHATGAKRGKNATASDWSGQEKNVSVTQAFLKTFWVLTAVELVTFSSLRTGSLAGYTVNKIVGRSELKIFGKTSAFSQTERWLGSDPRFFSLCTPHGSLFARWIFSAASRTLHHWPIMLLC